MRGRKLAVSAVVKVKFQHNRLWDTTGTVGKTGEVPISEDTYLTL